MNKTSSTINSNEHTHTELAESNMLTDNTELNSSSSNATVLATVLCTNQTRVVTIHKHRPQLFVHFTLTFAPKKFVHSEIPATPIGNLAPL